MPEHPTMCQNMLEHAGTAEHAGTVEHAGTAEHAGTLWNFKKIRINIKI